MSAGQHAQGRPLTSLAMAVPSRAALAGGSGSYRHVAAAVCV